MHPGEDMKRRDTSLFQWSLTLALWSNVGSGALRQSWSPLAKMSPEIQQFAAILLLILPSGLGLVLGVMSLKRKEWKPGWAISVIVLNMIGILVGILHLRFP
jgi:hypothetical protein